MPIKKAAKKTTKTAATKPIKKSVKAAPKKAARKPAKAVAKKPPTKKIAAKVKKGTAYECRVCGVRLIVDRVCGCVEEHVFLCCNKPMIKKRSARAA